jgi:hypothetical protein
MGCERMKIEKIRYVADPSRILFHALQRHLAGSDVKVPVHKQRALTQLWHSTSIIQ